MIDHCVSALQVEAREKRFRVYVTDALRLLTEGLARVSGGTYITARWVDVEDPTNVDTRTGDEIAADIIKRAGLVVNSE